MGIHAFLRLCFLVAAFGLAAPAFAADKTPQEKFADVVTLMNSGKFAEAIPILEDLKANYPTETVFWNLGLSATEVGDNAKALQAWLGYRNVAPDSWQGRAKLVQTYQALGDIDARDRERDALVALWKAGTNAPLSAQTLYCRDQFKQDGRKVLALEYFNPSGPKMVVYSFNVLNDAGQADFRISLGSYDNTNQVALELGERPKDKRLYHLDLYRAGMHETHGFFIGQPSYDDTRRLVVDVLTGKNKPISSSTKPPAS